MYSLRSLSTRHLFTPEPSSSHDTRCCTALSSETRRVSDTHKTDMTDSVVVREPARIRHAGNATTTASRRRPLGGFPLSAGTSVEELASMDSLAAMNFDDFRRHVTNTPVPSNIPSNSRSRPAQIRSHNPNLNRSPLPALFANVPAPQIRPETPQFSYEVSSFSLAKNHLSLDSKSLFHIPV